MDLPLLTSTAYATLFLRASRQPPARILAGTGLTEADLIARPYLDYPTMRQIIRNIESAGPEPGWSARVGERLHISSHGPLGFAALSAPTLGDALAVMAEYYPVRVSTLCASLDRVGGQLQFTLHDRTGDAWFSQRTVEPTMRVIQALLETIAGHPVGEYVKISFPWPAPEYTDVLEAVYGAPCVFEADAASISLPASWAHIPSPLYDEGSYRANIAKCRQVIAGLSPSPDAAARVRDLLASHFDRVRLGESAGAAPPSLVALAEELHTSPRTLIRRLKRQGTSYRSLLEKAQMDCADALLQQAQLTVAEVGERLGYNDPANFGRAFRKSTGVTPAAWRRGRR